MYSRLDQFPPEIKRIFDGFRAETDGELWESREELDDFARNEETIKKYASGDYGSNLVFKYKSLLLIDEFFSLNELAFRLTERLLESKGLLDTESWMRDYLKDLKAFCAARKGDVLTTQRHHAETFHFDLLALEEQKFEAHPMEFRYPGGIDIDIYHTPSQATYIETYKEVYGDTQVGHQRILANIYKKRMYRSISYAGAADVIADAEPEPLHKLELGPF